MSIAVSSLPSGPPQPAIALRRFSVDEYHQMIRAGILAEDEPVELLEGWIVTKMPRNPPHDGTIHVASQVLTAVLVAGWEVRSQSAIAIADSEPEPDLAVVRGRARDYMDHHPGVGEIGMLIEVADRSLEHDRTVKVRIYARAGIALYWIINLRDRKLEVYADPSGPDAEPAYRTRQDFGETDLVPVTLDGRLITRIPVKDLLP